ncbi:MAG: hypothetical protein NTU53_09540 [Planctomycetota bacterium]|nr:hypothetical protein [Planctomycetota bacterium]
MGLNSKEQNTINTRYPRCDGVQESGDVVFAFPTGKYKGDPVATCSTLQVIYDHLKSATAFDPSAVFGRRCIVAYRHSGEEQTKKDCSPAWNEHYVNIPWPFLAISEQPLECATHELAHPFVDLIRRQYDIGNKSNRFGCWVEGLCDFLRIGGFTPIGQSQEARTREALYKAAAIAKKGDSYHDPAGRLVQAMREQKLDPDSHVDVRKFLATSLPIGLSKLYGHVP